MTERVKAGWVAQAIIAALGSTLGAIVAMTFAPTPMHITGDSTNPGIVTWVYASCGAIAGGLLFSWLKDR